MDNNWKFLDIPDMPLEDGRWIEIVAHIQKCDTGEVRKYTTSDILYNDGGFNPFSWSDGNYSCDCNREIFFIGEYLEGRTCGEEKYKVNLENPTTGEIIYKEY